MGNNGGFNPYRDAHGRFADPSTAGKSPPKTSRLGKVNSWAYRPSPLPPKYRGKPKAAAKPVPAPKPQAPTVPKKYRDYSDMSSRVNKLEQQLKEAQRKVDDTSSRSRFSSAEAQRAAKTAAQQAAEAISQQLSEVRRDRNEYLDGMARYRSQDD